MNKIKLKVYKKVLHEVYGSGEFIDQKIKEICCLEKLLVEEVIYFVYERLCFAVSF